MLDIIARACRHPIDYSGICRTTDLKLIEKIDEGNGGFSFLMGADKLPGWKAGQHAIFTLPGKPVTGKTWRPFSVASAPSEGVIRIGTVVPSEPSSFKQQLSTLTQGETVRMHGPYGELYIRPNMERVIAVAGGIGITPFRAIISDLAHTKRNVQLTLIYSAKETHTYKNELESWAATNPNIKMIYVHTPEEVNAALESQTKQQQNNAHYLLSGAPGMITALRDKLRSFGIENTRVFNDPFKGY